MRLKQVFALLSVLFFGMFLLACGSEVLIESIQVDESAIEELNIVDVFVLEDLVLEVEFVDGTVLRVPITEDMISPTDLAKLQTPGEHTITVNYQGMTTPFTLILVENELAVHLRTIYEMALLAQATTLTYEDWLASIKGDDGKAGKEILLRAQAGFIQWQYEGETAWRNLIALSELTGPKGVDGKTVLFQVSNGFIQWQYQGESTWKNLIDMDVLKGTSGSSAYDRYKAQNPSYDGDLNTWLNDLVNGRLADQVLHEVIFYIDSSNQIIESILHGHSFETLPTPIKEGYVFAGWFTGDEVNDGQVTVLTIITRSITLYPRWHAIDDTDPTPTDPDPTPDVKENHFIIREKERGDQVLTVEIILTGDVFLNSYRIEITYNDAHLSVQSYVNGLNNVVNIDQSGRILFNYSNVMSSITEETVIITINFMILEQVSTSILIEVIEALVVTDTYEVLSVIYNESDLIITYGS